MPVSNLGARFDGRYAVSNDALLILRARTAWMHDFSADRSIAATFQNLPGAGFTVFGAAQARDAALVSAAAELRWRNGVSLDGEIRRRVLRSHVGLRRHGDAARELVRRPQRLCSAQSRSA